MVTGIKAVNIGCEHKESAFRDDSCRPDVQELACRRTLLGSADVDVVDEELSALNGDNIAGDTLDLLDEIDALLIGATAVPSKGNVGVLFNSLVVLVDDEQVIWQTR